MLTLIRSNTTRYMRPSVLESETTASPSWCRIESYFFTDSLGPLPPLSLRYWWWMCTLIGGGGGYSAGCTCMAYGCLCAALLPFHLFKMFKRCKVSAPCVRLDDSSTTFPSCHRLKSVSALTPGLWPKPGDVLRTHLGIEPRCNQTLVNLKVDLHILEFGKKLYIWSLHFGQSTICSFPQKSFPNQAN